MPAIKDLEISNAEVNSLIAEFGPMSLEQIAQATHTSKQHIRNILTKAARIARRKIAIKYALDKPMVLSWCDDITRQTADDDYKVGLVKRGAA
jgi:hypothetical protein